MEINELIAELEQHFCYSHPDRDGYILRKAVEALKEQSSKLDAATKDLERLDNVTVVLLAKLDDALDQLRIATEGQNFMAEEASRLECRLGTAIELLRYGCEDRDCSYIGGANRDAGDYWCERCNKVAAFMASVVERHDLNPPTLFPEVAVAVERAERDGTYTAKIKLKGSEVERPAQCNAYGYPHDRGIPGMSSYVLCTLEKGHDGPHNWKV